MEKLNGMLALLCGEFDNAEQYRRMQEQGETAFPFAEHRNTPCNDKIRGLPEGFSGVFVLEESYYTAGGKTHASPHLFLFTEEGDGVRLDSYELPAKAGEPLTYASFEPVGFAALRVSAKFTPAVYRLRDGVWEGGSVSMFSPVLKFTLFERFSPEVLEVQETMEVNGRRTFGYDEPILYRRRAPEAGKPRETAEF
ncbi:hypothetical protein [uncultured Oscillibacter sp.]|uniref:hypothetical protein n=2 Tax=uncultured Oscillibacter sp. TaxID=876091 RepID=UPI0025D671D8|nr:hypothetical protein [uncultured Oscillibacter sp.]